MIYDLSCDLKFVKKHILIDCGKHCGHFKKHSVILYDSRDESLSYVGCIMIIKYNIVDCGAGVCY